MNERLLRLGLEFPLASFNIVDDFLSKPEFAETIAAGVGGFTRNSCNQELYKLCLSNYGRRTNFTETKTGSFIRQLLVDQDLQNKLDRNLMAEARQELIDGFWKLVKSFMVTDQQATD